MKDLPIIEDILLVWNFKQCNSAQDIRTINKAQARLALTFLFVTLIFVGFQFFNVKWTDINSPLFVPAIIMIIIAGVAGGVVWRKEKEIKELVRIYKINERETNKEANYELQLVDGTTVRDNLKETKEYFYKNDGTKFYKTNVIYSKEIK